MSRNVFVGKPLSYTQVEYIEGTGTQYIDTGFKHNNNTRIVADIYCINGSQVSNYRDMFGSWGDVSSSKKMFGIEISNSNAGTLACYYGNGTSWNAGTKSGRFVYDFNKNVYTIGSSSYTFSAQTFQSKYNFLIFSATGYTGNIGSMASMRVYSFKIYDNGTLIRDYIPVIDQDNKACLFDLIENKFYYNKGTGDFLVPQEDTDEYITLNYIQSTGTQYIDTNFKPNNNTRAVAQIDFQPTASWEKTFGTWGGSSSSAGKFFGGEYNGTNYNTYYGVINNKSFATSTGYKGLAIWDWNKNVYKINSTSVTHNTSTFTSDFNMYIFGVTSYSGGISGLCHMKLYSFKIYDNGVLIRDYIPVKRKSDDVVCLYDLVNHTFYTNQGTGEFTAGETVGSRTNVQLTDKAKQVTKIYLGKAASYTPVEYIQNSGTQYIDTAFIPNFTTGFKIEMKVEPSVLGVRYSPISNFSGSTSSHFSGEITAANEGRFYANSGSLDIKQSGIILGENTLIYEFYNNTYKISVNGTLKTRFFFSCR